MLFRSMPVMEGKAVLFKEFGGVNAFPICLDTQDTEEIIKTVVNIAPAFGGINLEDISAPRCFEIEKKLREKCDIPVFHDDQHGTAIVTTAALINGLKLVDKKIEDVKVIINGAGSAGISIGKMIMSLGVKNLIVCGRDGALYDGKEGLNNSKSEMAKITNPNKEKGSLEEVIKGADVFIGVSGPNVVSQEMIKSMAKDSIVYAMANPTPEIMPEVAKAGGARVIGTGRSDFPNQINNVLAFPGIFRGALDVRATDINDEMKIAAAKAIAGIISKEELKEDYIIPDPFDKRVVEQVAMAVGKAAKDTGIARLK